MLSKNNYKERLRKMEQKKERFSIRKLSVGAASVLIGFFFMGVGSQTTVRADTVTPQVQAAKSNDNIASTSSKQEEKAPASQASKQVPSLSSSSVSKATSSAASVSSASQALAASKDNLNVAAENVTSEKTTNSNALNNTNSTSVDTHANGTGGYTQDGIKIPTPSEPYAQQVWSVLNNYIKPLSDEQLKDLGLDRDTFYESATNHTKWRYVNWVALNTIPGFETPDQPNEIYLGKSEYHRADGTLVDVQDDNW